MSWQRIDENTYIDDTLVTCAEYQLFIDEMREQEEYYQPDHWISYQFPAGQALKPILGARHSDAVAFCEWLTKREASEYHYRLPALIETTQYSQRIHQNPSYYGYWIKADANEQAQFVWMDTVPIDARRIDFARVLDTDSLNENTNAIAKFHQAIVSALNVDRVLARARHLTLDLDRIHVAFDKSEFYIDLARDLARNLAISFGRDLTIDRPLDHALDRARILARDHSLTFELTIDILIDIYTLQERLAGRSPAFEGIRLVKERIK